MAILAEREGWFKVLIKFFVGVLLESATLFRRIFVRISSPKAGGKALRLGPFDKISSAFDCLSRFVVDNGKKPLV
jgi:hypothetical protein